MAGELTCQYRQNHIMRGTLRRMLDMTSTPPAGPHPAPRTPSGQFCYELTVWVGRTATPLASAGHTSAFWQPVPLLLPDSPTQLDGRCGVHWIKLHKRHLLLMPQEPCPAPREDPRPQAGPHQTPCASHPGRSCMCNLAHGGLFQSVAPAP